MQMTIQHNWQRFWSPRESAYFPTGNGYLADPTISPNNALMPHVKTMEQLAEMSCLVMLGEPGIGKSTEIDAMRKTSVEKAAEIGEKVYYVDLRSIGSDQRLFQKLFESQEFKSWCDGSYRLHLFLDSLDESLLRVATVATILADELPQYPVDRLTLRIACRTVVWPSVLEDALRLWSDDSLCIYELLPLREADVVAAAKNYDVDPEDFLLKVAEARAVPFAIKPITLNFLLRTYIRDGNLPNSQSQLYQEGCRILCEEANPSRQGSGLPQTLDSDERLVIAARIAAITVFGQKSAIATGADTGGLSDAVLPARMLTGGSEPSERSTPAVSASAIREVLDTGLFSSRGPDLMGWAHQTYAEFLAAKWVCWHHLSLKNICTLIDHPTDDGIELVPQLYETIAWIASERPDIRDYVEENAPSILLMSDASAMDPETRQQIVAQILTHVENDKLSIRKLWGSSLQGLNHPGLPQQLKPYLVEPSTNTATRSAAVEFADACRCADLEDDLANIALDSGADYNLRFWAASTVSRIANKDCRERLLPLASLTANEDPRDNLRGCALAALWPDCIQAGQLFTFLTPLHHPNHFGAFKSFIHDFTRHLKPDDLPVALQWVARQSVSVMSISPFEIPIIEIMRIAWDNLDEPGVLDELAVLAFQRLDNYESPFDYEHRNPAGELTFLDDVKRRKINAHLILLSANEPNRLEQLVRSSHLLFTGSDVPWLLEQLEQSSTKPIRQTYATIISDLVDPRTAEFNIVYEARDTYEELKEALSLLLGPVLLDSEKAAYMRRQYETSERIRKQERPAPVLLNPPPNALIQRDLAALEGGDLDAWVSLNRNLQLEPDSTYYRDDQEDDLTALPGWQQADNETRTRILNGARQFAIGGKAYNEVWAGTKEICLAALAGYHALQLLMLLQPEFLDDLPDKSWSEWAPIILRYPNSDIDQLQEHLTLHAYNHVPDDVIQALLLLIDWENSQYKHIFFALRRMKECCDSRLGSALVEKLEDPALTPTSLGVLMDYLLSFSGEALLSIAEKTIAFAKRIVTDFATRGIDHDRALAVVVALLTYRPSEGWQIVWPIIQKDDEFGRSLLEDIAHAERASTAFLQSLDEAQLAELFSWLEDHYPTETDPVHKAIMAHFIGPTDSVRHFRGSVLNHLSNRGTPAARAAIKQLSVSLPHLPWLKEVLRETQDLTLRRTWEPLSPQAILALANDPENLTGAKMKIKVLFIAANPIGTASLALDEEIREIMIKIRASDYRDDMLLIPCWAARPTDLLQALNEHKPHIVHFSGHGSDAEEIILMDDNGNPMPVSKEALEFLFRTLKDNVKVVVLNACYSRPQAEALSQIIGCAIGMNTEIGDVAGITFAAAFYLAIGFGRSLQEAFDQGKAALMLQGIPEDKTPELLTKTGVDPSRINLIG